MIGAITGDIVGSIYEFDNIKTKKFPLFGENCKFTDDTVLTVAVADWLTSDSDLTERLTHYSYKYSARGYGNMYLEWLNSWDRQPYNSYGNGSAMRVSAVGWLEDEGEVLGTAQASAEVTHDHPEGIKGAQATAMAIYLARHGNTPLVIRDYISWHFDYDLTPSVDEIRETYKHNETCQKTVPQAITCALEATDFEDAIRNAISIGGDSDTIAAIAGGIAQAIFGIPADIRDKALTYLPEEFVTVISRMNERTASAA
jgi:ADP-ribosylglycohydrolase